LHVLTGPVPSGATTLALLDRESRSLHAEADRAWTRFLHDDKTTRDDYIQQLVATYGFESSFEAACSGTPGLSQLLDLRGRWRSKLILQDLLAAGLAEDVVANLRCASLGPFQDRAEALAWMYVVERPTLIFADLHEALTSRFVDLTRATFYLRAYDGVVSKRWSALGIALDQLCNSEKVCKRVTEAACAAFQALIEWRAGRAASLRSAG
jgi:heme oxygenase